MSLINSVYKKFSVWLFSVRNIISVSCHERVYLMRLPFERYFSHHRDRLSEKHHSERSLIKNTCS